MKAILHTGGTLEWLPADTGCTWPLLPVGNRPLIEYWIECCIANNIRDVRIILADDAHAIESFCGDGSRWGITIEYSFVREGTPPDAYPRRSPSRWEDGLLYLRGPLFPRRDGSELRPIAENESFALGPDAFLCRDPERLRVFLDGGDFPGDSLPFPPGLRPQSLASAKDYFDLNMDLVGGEITRYLQPGYSLLDDSFVGYNVVLPPSCQTTTPLMIGNDCRLRPLCAVGPSAVIGNNVVIDSQAELSTCVVLDGTYIGRNLELRGKIVGRNVIIDPETGVSLSLEDPILLGRTGTPPLLQNGMRVLFGSLAALALALFQAPLFVILFLLILVGKRGSFRFRNVLDRQDRPLRLPEFHGKEGCALASLFQALSLDRWPSLGLVLLQRLHLVGHLPIDPQREPTLRSQLPASAPAVFSEELLNTTPASASFRPIYALHYLHTRSLIGDLRSLGRTLLRRLLQRCAQEPTAHD